MRRGRVPELGIFLLVFQIVKNIGVANIPPVTFIAMLAQIAVYLQFLVVPRLCISGEGVWLRGEYLRLLVPAIRHTHDLHLYYNMVSLAWKGISLERRMGSFRYFCTLVTLTVMSSVAYVLLAVIASDLSEDYSYMQQCAIGFSGVLFALKVLNSHYRSSQERDSVLGFSLPLKYGVWVELLLIQIMIPNTSFLGHLGGILAGLAFIKGPIGWSQSLVSSTSSSLSVPPATSGLVLGLVGAHLGYLGGPPLTGCLSTSVLHTLSWSSPSLKTLQALALVPFHHLGAVHLGINLLSFYMKGRKLEHDLGLCSLLKLAASALLVSTFLHWVLNRVLHEASGVYPADCIVGLSGPLFALKILTLLNCNGFDATALYELIELLVLLEPRHRVYHGSGLLAGLLIAFWSRPQAQRITGAGQRLGGRGSPEVWTRSWGYGPFTGTERRAVYPSTEQSYGDYRSQDDADYDEAIRRSRQSYAQETGSAMPSAPPYEEMMREPSPSPHYTEHAAPPPPGGVELDELRRRRLARFNSS